MLSYKMFNLIEYVSEAEDVKKPKGNPGGKKAVYKDLITAFDIETCRIPGTDEAAMYMWQWAFEGTAIYGRTWDDLRCVLCDLDEAIPEGTTLVVYVHNLSYEFQFLRTVIDFTRESVFALESRKVAKCTALHGKIEFRCSYVLTGLSLDLFTTKMQVVHRKLSGEDFNYKEARYPWTPLTSKQLAYCENDVLGLVEAIRAKMDQDEDTLVTIPLTATGYVRRETKRTMKSVSHWLVHDMLPGKELYIALREAFRGGNTHANRYYAGQILENVISFDRSSSYPDTLCNCQYPMTAFEKRAPTIESLKSALKYKRAVLMRVRFIGFRLLDEFDGCPYISLSKCRAVVQPILDNGRILRAQSFETTITDVDYRILLTHNAWDRMEILDLWSSHYKALPRVLIEQIRQYYAGKTELKGVEGQEVFYNRSKEMLNSIYGLMAQDPVRQDITFDGMGFNHTEEYIGALLAKANRRAFLSYAWGVWCTAWARFRLQEGIDLVGDKFVYADTDSVKYINEGGIDWTDYNRRRIEDSTASLCYAVDPKGKTHYMGVFEYDGSYQRFRTWGAKKYAYEDQDGELHTTVAGVSKKKGAAELAKKGGLDTFAPGFIFREAGGTESVYNDRIGSEQISIDGHAMELGANICIKDSAYTVSITDEYGEIIDTANRILLNKDLAEDILHRITE